jgi:hypothetical protein
LGHYFSAVEMKKPPPNVHFDEERQLLVWKPLGTITEAIVNEILTFLAEKEASSPNPFNRFTDTSAQGPVEVSFAYIFHVALYRRLSYSGRPPVKSAFFATDPEVARIVKVHALLTDHSPLQVALFDKREEAALWLGVPIDALVVK